MQRKNCEGESEYMKIGILGAGKVGRTLGRKFEDVGYEVLYGTRSEREGTMSLQEVASNV